MLVYMHAMFFRFHISEGIYDVPDDIQPGTSLGIKAYVNHYKLWKCKVSPDLPFAISYPLQTRYTSFSNYSEPLSSNMVVKDSPDECHLCGPSQMVSFKVKLAIIETRAFSH